MNRPEEPQTRVWMLGNPLAWVPLFGRLLDTTWKQSLRDFLTLLENTTAYFAVGIWVGWLQTAIPYISLAFALIAFAVGIPLELRLYRRGNVMINGATGQVPLRIVFWVGYHAFCFYFMGVAVGLWYL